MPAPLPAVQGSVYSAEIGRRQATLVSPQLTGAVWRAVLLLAAGPWSLSLAQQPVQQVPGGVDLTSSRVYVFVGKTGFGHDHAVVGRLQAGEIRLDAAEQAGRLVFEMGSVLADTSEARKVLGLAGETDAGTQKQTTDNMLGPEVLDVARHPTATLEIRSALPAPQGAPAGRKAVYELNGTFTLHGVTRQVVIPVEIESLDGVIRLSGGFPIKQTDFGMKPYKKLGGVVGVADDLKIYGDIRLPVPRAAAPSPNPGAVR